MTKQITHKLFTYGTLKKGLSNSHFIANEKFIKKDTVKGTLFSLTLYGDKPTKQSIKDDICTGWPGLILEGNNIIPGEIYIVKDEIYQRTKQMEISGGYKEETIKTQAGETVKIFLFKNTEYIKTSKHQIPSWPYDKIVK